MNQEYTAPGIYLVNATGDMTPLATEKVGEGDAQLLEEALEAHGYSLGGKGKHHLDDREPLAYAYYGHKLIGVAYDETLVEHWKDATDYEVVPTPKHEDRT